MNLKISDIGEFGAIDLIKSVVGDAGIPVAIGDDCAAIEIGDNYVVMTTDMLAQETDVVPQAKPWQIGWYAVAINLSDLAAKGAKPLAFLSSIALPGDLHIEFLKELYGGMNRCAKEYGCSIVGGDTNSHYNLVISGTAIGIMNKNEFIRRSGAKKNDIVAVTGELGLAALGLEILLENEKMAKKYKKATDALLTPKPRVNEGIFLAKNGLCTSSIDISDGLASSLHQLSRASKVGFLIDQDLLPINREVIDWSRDEDHLEKLAFYTGGEYELLLTMGEENFRMARKNMKIKKIGYVIEEMDVLMKKGKKEKELKDYGYVHF